MSETAMVKQITVSNNKIYQLDLLKEVYFKLPYGRSNDQLIS